MRRAYLLAFEDDDHENIRRPRWIAERKDNFNDLDDHDFKLRYRISKQTALTVLEYIEEDLEFQTDKNNSISPMNQLLCALRFYATGCYQTVSADLCGFSTSTANRIVHRVSRALASLRPQHISFPETEAAIRKTQRQFYNKARFPRVIGAIDCTHIKLTKSTGGDNAEIFRNRKGFFSLNVQAICNANLEFIDIVARWPGSTHDSHIFNNCYRKAMFEQGRYGNSLLLGDAGYACKPYMMTPLNNCQTPNEHLYNEAHIRTRNSVERLFGVWKRRFPCMAIGLGVTLQNCFPIIIATAVIHNIARRSRDDVPDDDPNLILPQPWDILLDNGNINIVQNHRENINHRIRRILIEHHFGRLIEHEEGN